MADMKTRIIGESVADRQSATEIQKWKNMHKPIWTQDNIFTKK